MKFNIDTNVAITPNLYRLVNRLYCATSGKKLIAIPKIIVAAKNTPFNKAIHLIFIGIMKNSSNCIFGYNAANVKNRDKFR